MSDPGAIDRNARAAQIALDRASQRNGGQNIPASAPASVLGTDSVPSMAVNGPRRRTGTIEGGE